ncbi:galactoside alpha-(1,2)-fucosyltransferase 2-like [Hydractinia symbiolongicarpus]|uniref:galactoside alpha-(1,2)-fucosyltransferase 2-like n=1 Tax=Hydractinia symbiolongicarpus TaxID=13093 RepID=UPI00254D23C0|nr:galactoside alpha-(1,2)-fucosyltransferase 2-like [Hydractinia symbiolongicarpus]
MKKYFQAFLAINVLYITSFLIYQRFFKTHGDNRKDVPRQVVESIVNSQEYIAIKSKQEILLYPSSRNDKHKDHESRELKRKAFAGRSHNNMNEKPKVINPFTLPKINKNSEVLLVTQKPVTGTSSQKQNEIKMSETAPSKLPSEKPKNNAVTHPAVGTDSFPNLKTLSDFFISRHGSVFKEYSDSLPAHSVKNTDGYYNLVVQSANLGIGYRMFIYAAGYGIAKKSNRTLRYQILAKEQLVNTFNIFQRESYNSSFKWKSYLHLGTKLCCKYYPQTRELPEENIFVEGYLQSWKYFHEYKKDILKEFTFKDEIATKAQSFLTTTMQNRSENVVPIAIHIRRNDMMSKGNAKFSYSVADKSYLDRAIAYFKKKFNCIFIVASRDMAWTKENLKEYKSQTVFCDGNSAEVDLAILSSCKHMITSVGTYSWWAAYLTGGEVVYYKDWPRKNSTLSSYVNHDDYFPPEWIGM